MKEQFDKIIHSDHHDPFQVLGVHFPTENKKLVIIRTFQPHATSVELVTSNFHRMMIKVRDEGLYEIQLDRSSFDDQNLDPYSYQFRINYHLGNSLLINDPYRFLPQMLDVDRHLFNFGTHYELYNQIGAHPATFNNIQGTIFRVWAPSARRVSILGDFNGWDGRVHQMRSLGDSGIWELFLPAVGEDTIYKLEIRAQDGTITEKSDPFQFYGEFRPKTASIVRYLDHHQWQDNEWQQNKTKATPWNQAMSIYEVHPGSWKRDPSDPERFLTFRELADYLIPYILELGFTHVELMPVMEHPLDESWGYQITAPFSMTSRYGTPEDLMYFVDQCHQNNIGVILDWVPAHFPKDEHSLARFDGTALFEHEDPRKGAHPEWGTYIYNYGRREVSNFLIANALFWLDKYHIDGLRVDAVASMLYLDYSRKDGEWIPNCYGGNENLEAIEFIKHMNSVIFDRFPNTLMMAEESTSFYGVSKPASSGGLGFGFKWNMGWMNDTLNYFAKDPLYRKYHHNVLTFSIMYAFSENFVLPLSHDEVVHGKRSLIDKMPGDLWQKFANLRLLYLSMWMHPGKKLLFMGGEFGQWSEWHCKQSLDWHLLDENNLHGQLQSFVGDLNRMYRANPCLWEQDFNYDGFQWLDIEARDDSIISYVRYGKNRDDHLICLLNFTPQTLDNYKLGLPANRTYKIAFCSDSSVYGGSNTTTQETYTPIDEPFAQAPYHTRIKVPPLAGIILQPI